MTTKAREIRKTIKPGTIAPKISVVIPAKNEEKNLPYVLLRIPEVHEVLLVDGLSTDRTNELAKELCPSIRIVKQDGRGKGNAIRCGVKAAKGDIIVMIDADGSMDPAEIPSFVAPLLKGYDFTKGSRFIKGGGTTDMPLQRKFGNWVFVTLVNLLYRGRYTDLCYGYNAFWKDAYDQLSIVSDGFEIETELNVKALKNNLKVTEVPSFEKPRISGAGNLRAFQDGKRIIKAIFKLRFGDMK